MGWPCSPGRDERGNVVGQRLRQEHGVDVVAHVEVARDGETLTDQDLVGSRRIGQPAGDHSGAADLGAGSAVGRGKHADPRERLRQALRRRPCFRYQGHAGEQPHPAHPRCASHCRVEGALVGPWLSGRRHQQLGGVDHLEQAVVGGRRALGPGRGGEDDPTQRGHEEGEAERAWPASPEVAPQPIRDDTTHIRSVPVGDPSDQGTASRPYVGATTTTMTSRAHGQARRSTLLGRPGPPVVSSPRRIRARC